MSSSLVCQQIIALDAKYKNYRCRNSEQFRTPYLRRRMQILRDYSKNNKTDPDIRKDYLKLRKQVICRLFGHMSEASSMIGSSVHSSRLQLDKNEEDSSASPSSKQPSLLVPTEQAEASRKMAGGKSVGENYAFRGMHHIFDHHAGHKATCVKFANDEKNLLAYSSMSGSLFVCETSQPCRVLHQLDKHEGGVTDLAWSLSNDLIVSVGVDSFLRLWNAKHGKLLREIKSTKLEMNKCPLHCCLFQPLNNNMALCGNSCGQIAVVNISTGKTVKGGSGKVAGAVLSMAFDSSGKILWAGTDNGYIYSFTFDLATGGRLRKQHAMQAARLCLVSCIQARSWASRQARDPSVLVNLSNNKLCLYRVVDERGLLELRRSFEVKHSKELIRSAFCPIMSFRRGACVVSGSEDTSIGFFDIEREMKSRVNTLQGHSSSVIDVDFNFDESLLVSCDLQGMVIVWKRE